MRGGTCAASRAQPAARLTCLHPRRGHLLAVRSAVRTDLWRLCAPFEERGRGERRNHNQMHKRRSPRCRLYQFYLTPSRHNAKLFPTESRGLILQNGDTVAPRRKGFGDMAAEDTEKKPQAAKKAKRQTRKTTKKVKSNESMRAKFPRHALAKVLRVPRSILEQN